VLKKEGVIEIKVCLPSHDQRAWSLQNLSGMNLGPELNLIGEYGEKKIVFLNGEWCMEEKSQVA
jgi:hypothetical protein